MRRLTLQEVITRNAVARELQRRRNAARMRGVAARLPVTLPKPRHGRVNSEAGTPGRAPASTTTTRAGVRSGYATQSA